MPQAAAMLVLCGGSDQIVDLVAYQEPNVLPIKDFFYDENRVASVNYLGALVTDATLAVREAFFQMIGDWMT